MTKLLRIVVLMVPLTGCDLAPEFKLPDILVPNAFKEDKSLDAVDVAPATDGKWKRFDEKAKIDEFAWWRMFNDEALNALMEQAMKENPSLEVAINRVVSARSVADTREADLYPSISAGIGPERSKQSPAAQEPNMPPGTTAVVKPYTLYRANGTITYELDLFGRNRGRMRAAAADAEAEENNYRAARLTLQTDVAQTYFRVASLKAEKAILTEALAAREKALEITRAKRDVGAIDDLAFASMEADVANVRADAAAVAQSLAVAEHALAVLMGVPPSEFQIQTTELNGVPPTIPAGIPSGLLERRPDIKQAEQQIAAANERIGVARTGYFPDISISAMGGFVAGDADDLFKWSNRTWMIGPLAGTVLTQPIFEGGKIAAARAQTEADYAGAVANYRLAVLTAFREVEDQLSGLRNAAVQQQATEDSLAASTRAYEVAEARFKVGYSSYLDYLEAQRNYLAAKRAKTQTRGNQYILTVQLVKALGGSWQAMSVPENTAVPAELPAELPKAEEAPTMEEPPAADLPTSEENWWDGMSSLWDETTQVVSDSF